MCRLFGFRSPVPGMVHRSLVEESNCLARQSHEHPDGWGIGYYQRREILVSKSAGAAFEDAAFARISGMVKSDCVVAHVRKASVGSIGVENSHPFRLDPFLFVHNGTLHDFDELVRDPLERQLAPEYRQMLRGETDSERCFYLFLTFLQEVTPLEKAGLPEMAEALAQTVFEVRRLSAGCSEPPSTNFLVTNGDAMVAFRSGRTLFYSTELRKNLPPDLLARETDEAEARQGGIRHLLIASEELSAEDVWIEVPEDGFVGTDGSMQLRRWDLSQFEPRKRSAA